VEVLRQQAPRFAAMGLDFRVRAVCVADAARQRPELAHLRLTRTAGGAGAGAGDATLLTTDHTALTEDPAIDMLVEVAGGTGAARTAVLSAARRGKSVVTANKALLAAHLPEMEAAFPADGRARLGFEAAVAGGVPIIRAMQQSLAPDTVTSVAGILNGTTNFMLSAMASAGAPYADVLREAQAAGFAEADPTADVEGHDARNKLVLLARLGLGVTLPVGAVRTVGISGVTPADFALARELGCTVKLIGRAALTGGGSCGGGKASAVEASVTPALVPLDGALGTTGGALNLVAVDSAYVGRSEYRGPGAGRFPTANSVVADMLSIALGTASAPPFPLPRALTGGRALSDDVTCEAFVRLSGSDGGRVGAAGEAVAAALGAQQPRPRAVTQTARAAGGSVGLLVDGGSLNAVTAAVARAVPAGGGVTVAVYPVFR
jgi:homoserine dehydrogenase